METDFENIIPDLKFFLQEENAETQLNLSQRRIKIVNYLLNTKPENMPEIHLETWYSDFWNFLSLCKYAAELKSPSEQSQNICNQLLNFAAQEKNSVKLQYIFLALLLFGRFEKNLLNQNLWSEKLRRDFKTFFDWYNLVDSELDITAKAMIKRNRQIEKFLTDNFADVIKKYSDTVIDDKNCPKVAQEDFKIYFCWFQGEKNLPPLVQCCYNSLKLNAGNYKICFIDEENFSDYVDLPTHILQKFRAGKISRTHFSDILRINLLERYGGLWLDSTVLVTESLESHKDLFELPYFTQKFCPEKDNLSPYTKQFRCYHSYARWASFIQGTNILHNPLFAFEKDFYEVYWQEYDEIIDYLLIDFMMDIACKNILAVREEMSAVPINNIETYAIMNNLNNLYEKYPFDKILSETFLHKLSWKIKLDMENKNTVFAEIQRRYG